MFGSSFMTPARERANQTCLHRKVEVEAVSLLPVGNEHAASIDTDRDAIDIGL
jgi:hypothetical protein